MDAQMDFRSLLLKLQDRLSERDRLHLHFLLGDIIPRQLRKDASIGGTLELLETLFDQAKINDQDFGYLIQAFREIGCYDIVKRLEIHQQTQQQRKLPTSLPVLNELLNYNEYDKLSSTAYDKTVSPSNGCDSPDSTSSLLSSNAFTNCNQPKTHISNVFNVGKEPWSLRSILRSKPRIFLAVSLVLNIFSFIVIFILIHNRNYFRQSLNELRTDDTDGKEGPAHGSNSETPFNDAVELSLTCKARCVGVEVHWRTDFLYSIRFIYDKNSTVSPIHHGRDGGRHQSRYDAIFMLENNEEINAITLYEGKSQGFQHGNISFIVGITFHTTHARTSELYGSADGNVAKESFPGYTFGYAKGRAGLVVDQLQFIWCSMCSKANK